GSSAAWQQVKPAAARLAASPTTAIANTFCRFIRRIPGLPEVLANRANGKVIFLAIQCRGRNVMSIILQSPAFKQHQPIPRKHTGDGDDVSPELSWTGVPPAAVELTLIVDDPDAPTPEPWVHWVLYKIPSKITRLDEH